MATKTGTLWSCDVNKCNHAIFQAVGEDTPKDWKIHEVDGLFIVCCPEHHKAFVGAINCFVRNISIDMQALIDSYEETFLQ